MRKALAVGMEKSGRAVAAFLAERGDTVTTTDLKPHDVPGFRQQSDELFNEPWDLIVLSPGVPADLRWPGASTGARCRRNRRDRTCGAVPAGQHDRHHRLQWQDHHNLAGGPHPATRRSAGSGGWKYRNPRDCNGGNLPRRAMERAGAFQFSTRNHPDVPRACRGLFERHAESFGSPLHL